MIRLVKHGDIDATRWNETVGASGFPTVFCTYEMLDALVGGATWNALVMDDYDYVMPLPERSKFGVHYVYSPFFVSQMGIFSAKPVTAQITSDFFNALPSADKHVDLLLNQSNATDFIDSYTISLVTHTLALYKDYQELSSAYSQNTRRNVKAARKSDLVMKSDEVGVEQVVRLFQENRGQRKEVRFKPKDYEILTQAASVLKSQGLLEVLSVHTREGQLIAGALMVRDFQSVISKEIKAQTLEKEGRLPDAVVACVGGGSNAIGSFYHFIDDKSVRLIGCEAAGRGVDTFETAATIATGRLGIFHGMKSYFCQDKYGQIAPVYSISAGLDYPGVGPEHAMLHDLGRAEYVPITDEEAVDAFEYLSRTEGIIPAIESAHAVAHVRKIAPQMDKENVVVVTISGRGDKDCAAITRYRGEDIHE